MNKTGWLVTLVMVFGCGDPERPPSIGPASEATPPAPPVDEPTGAPTAGSAASVTGPVMRVIDLPDREIRLGSSPSVTRVPPFRLRHPSAAVTAELDRTLSELERQTDVASDVVESYTLGDRVGCDVSLSREDLVSVACLRFDSPDRWVPVARFAARTYAIEGDSLERIAVPRQLAPGTDLGAMFLAECRRRVRQDPTSDAPPVEERCASLLTLGEVHVTERGLRTMSVSDRFDVLEVGLTVPFAELDRRVLADTPLGRALASVEGAAIVEVPLPEGAVPPGETARGQRLTEPSSLAETLESWWRLPVAERVGVLAVPAAEPLWSGQFVLAIPDAGRAGSDPPRVSLEPIEWTQALTPFVARARRDVSLRLTPYGSVRGDLPQGTLMVGARGEIASQTSSSGARNTWLAVALTRGMDGWLAGNLVEPNDGCEPDPTAFLARLGRSEAARARGLVSLGRAVLDVRTPRPTRAALFFATRAPNLRDRHLRVGVYALDEACAVGRRMLEVDVEGRYVSVVVTSTMPRGGESLLAVASDRPEGDLVNVRRIATGADLGTYPSFSLRAGETVAGTYYPLMLDEEEALVWENDALRRVTLPEAAPR
ncbi:MAG: hypothetical protein AB7S26_04170 [Sandaracinaceae bacterium]